MTEDVAISLHNVSKAYRAYFHPLGRLIQLLPFAKRIRYREFPALQNISLDIRKGETVGIIGRNGSGKSTLLQLICGIRKPSSGTVYVKGRISALLELGAGFHPEFTGRENVMMQGAIMGFSSQEMESRLPEIAAFADIGEYLDQPIRTYSSGMFVRLAFATAIHVDPDILIIDEAIAVGDFDFQRKSFERISQLVENKNITVILVSHDLRQIQRFASRALYLEHGRCVLEGDPSLVCQAYYEASFSKKDAPHAERGTISSTDEVQLISVHVRDQNQQETDEIASGTPVNIIVRFRLTTPMRKPEFVVGTQAADFTYLSSASTAELGNRPDFAAGEHEIEYMLEQFPLAPGEYHVRFNVRDEHFRLVFVGEGLKTFHVTPDADGANRPIRMLNLKTAWRLDGELANSPDIPRHHDDSIPGNV